MVCQSCLHRLNTAEKRGCTRKKKHLAFFDPNVFEYPVFDDSEEHSAFDLVEPFLGS